MPNSSSSSCPEPVVWTVGHSNRTAEAVCGLLGSHGIQRVVDVRTMPRSRRNPQFNRDAFADTLAAAGIGYDHWPALGGLRKPRADSPNTGWRNTGFRGYADHMTTPAFLEALAALFDRAQAERLALMCAEAVPWRCHRSLIADALVSRDAEVRHILAEDRADAHVLNPMARIEDGHLVYPAPGESLDLF